MAALEDLSFCFYLDCHLNRCIMKLDNRRIFLLLICIAHYDLLAIPGSDPSPESKQFPAVIHILHIAI